MTPNLATAETPFFPLYGRDPNLPLHQLLEPMQWFVGDPESGLLSLETSWLALAIVKKTPDEDYFRTAQKTMDRKPPSFKIGNRAYFKNKQLWKWGPQVETWILDCLYWAQWTLPTHWKSGHRENKVMQHQGYSTWTTSGILKHWHTIHQSQLTSHHPQQLKTNTLLM